MLKSAVGCGVETQAVSCVSIVQFSSLSSMPKAFFFIRHECAKIPILFRERLRRKRGASREKSGIMVAPQLSFINFKFDFLFFHDIMLS